MWCYITVKSVLILSVLLQHCLLIKAYPQDTDKNNVPPTLRPGRYVPELFGAARGKYMPDDSGKYRHIKVPYDGGYGDRGVKYVHDVRVFQPKGANDKLPLDERDHLRFMIDFNYDSNGWQIIQLEWLRDGDETRQYKYVNENQLWDTTAQNPEAANAPADASVGVAAEPAGGYEAVAQTAQAQPENTNTNVHVDGEYEANMFNVSYSNDNAQNAPSQGNIRDAIREVLEYIQTYVLPTIN